RDYKVTGVQTCALPISAASASHTGISGNVETDGNGNSTVYLQAATLNDVLKAVDLATGVQTATLSSSGATLATASGAVNSSVVRSEERRVGKECRSGWG